MQFPMPEFAFSDIFKNDIRISKNEIGIGIQKNAIRYARIGILKHFQERAWHRDSEKCNSLCQNWHFQE